VNVNTDTKEFSIGLWQVYSAIPDDLNVNKTPIEDLCPYFSREVLKHVDLWLDDVDICYIESQPMGRTRNLKTKVLSHILQILLLSKKEIPIQFIHPTLKLKNMVGERNYRANKKFAIQETERLLENTAFVDLFIGKKRDDLADCFLQGYYACWTKPKEDIQHLKQASKTASTKASRKATSTIIASETIVEETLQTTSRNDVKQKDTKILGKRKQIKDDRTSKRLHAGNGVSAGPTSGSEPRAESADI
jgi:hypothetical protein